MISIKSLVMEEKSPQILTESKGSSMDGRPATNNSIKVIELHMMDPTKYYPLALLSGTAIRTVLYPVSLVKTRLQIQNKKTLYNGTWDAFKKISHLEGIQGLYRGYLVSCLFIVPQVSFNLMYPTYQPPTTGCNFCLHEKLYIFVINSWKLTN